MVLTKTPVTWSTLVQAAQKQCMVILPAGSKHSTLALTLEFDLLDYSSQVIESATGEYFITSEGYAEPSDSPPIIEVVRKLSLPWFMWRCYTDRFVVEPTPQMAALTDLGFSIGEKLVVVSKIYVKAPKNTVWGHSHGYDIGDHICSTHK